MGSDANTVSYTLCLDPQRCWICISQGILRIMTQEKHIYISF